MAGRPGMRHVAKAAGVAMSTVSRVLSGHPDVSPHMRERVMRAVAELSYEPDFLAQSLRRGATFSVGFSVSDISNPVIAQIALGAEEVLRNAGYSMFVMNSENDPTRDAANARYLQNRRVDGLILFVGSERNKATNDLLARLEIPIVVIDRDLPKRVRASAVLLNHRIGMATAVGYLLDFGHRRIGLVSWPMNLRPGRERFAGLEHAYTSRKLPPTFLHVAGPLTADQAEMATDELLDRPDPPTALIAGANQLLIGCLRALIKRGLHPGEDLALVTCDEVPLAELYTPPIAAIARDNVATGGTAADLLLRRLNGQAEPLTMVLGTTFIPRASCMPPRSP
jgi:LacI family transcriptional regulator